MKGGGRPFNRFHYRSPGTQAEGDLCQIVGHSGHQLLLNCSNPERIPNVQLQPIPRFGQVDRIPLAFLACRHRVVPEDCPQKPMEQLDHKA